MPESTIGTIVGINDVCAAFGWSARREASRASRLREHTDPTRVAVNYTPNEVMALWLVRQSGYQRGVVDHVRLHGWTQGAVLSTTSGVSTVLGNIPDELIDGLLFLYGPDVFDDHWSDEYREVLLRECPLVSEAA